MSYTLRKYFWSTFRIGTSLFIHIFLQDLYIFLFCHASAHVLQSHYLGDVLNVNLPIRQCWYRNYHFCGYEVDAPSHVEMTVHYMVQYYRTKAFKSIWLVMMGLLWQLHELRRQFHGMAEDFIPNSGKFQFQFWSQQCCSDCGPDWGIRIISLLALSKNILIYSLDI